MRQLRQSQTSTSSLWQLWFLRRKSSGCQKSEDQEKISVTLKGVTGFKKYFLMRLILLNEYS